MTLQEAAMSKLPFKRKSWSENSWLKIRDNLFFYFENGSDFGSDFILGLHDILADDYEVKEKVKAKKEMEELHAVMKTMTEEEIKLLVLRSRTETAEVLTLLHKNDILSSVYV